MRIPIRTPYGTFEVHARRTGIGANQVLVLHGGPGTTHDYLTPLEALDAEVIFYDQLGSGLSDQPDDERLWTIERFVDEIEQVRAALGLERVVLYGHSWGAILAIEYALVHGARVKALVLSNAMTDMQAHNRAVEAQVSGLGISPDHPDFLMRFLGAHMCRVTPWPAPLQTSFTQFNTQVQRALRGSDPFLIGGALAQWNRTREVRDLAIPMLLLTGAHDAATDQYARLAGEVPHAEHVEFAEASHTPMWETREPYLAAIASWISSCTAGEAGRSGGA